MQERTFVIKNYNYAGVNSAVLLTESGNYDADGIRMRKGNNLEITFNLYLRTKAFDLTLYTDEGKLLIPGSWPRNDKKTYNGPRARSCYNCKSSSGKLRQCGKCGKVQCKSCLDKKFTLSSIVKLPFTVATLGIINTRKKACLHCRSTSIHKL